jgi:hypothetical protein
VSAVASPGVFVGCPERSRPTLNFACLSHARCQDATGRTPARATTVHDVLCSKPGLQSATSSARVRHLQDAPALLSDLAVCVVMVRTWPLQRRSLFLAQICAYLYKEKRRSPL